MLRLIKGQKETNKPTLTSRKRQTRSADIAGMESYADAVRMYIPTPDYGYEITYVQAERLYHIIIEDPTFSNLVITATQEQLDYLRYLKVIK